MDTCQLKKKKKLKDTCQLLKEKKWTVKDIKSYNACDITEMHDAYNGIESCT